jgi:hypothetical protein
MDRICGSAATTARLRTLGGFLAVDTKCCWWRTQMPVAAEEQHHDALPEEYDHGLGPTGAMSGQGTALLDLPTTAG